ncbi:MAG: hypothetical protein V1818_02360, partial [Candidatus Aenigmatarchaeota archaeon]
MKGVSAIIVTILLLMVSVSLVSLAYSFLSQTVSETTELGEESVSQVSKSLLSDIKIDSIYNDEVYVRNSGRVEVTQLKVFVNEIADSGATVPSSILPGYIGTITLSAIPVGGDVIKV